ncbi:MAG: hypothetical protein ACOZQL_13705 [Myxococcota bacterium]
MRAWLVVAVVAMTGCESAPATIVPLDLGVVDLAHSHDATLRVVNATTRDAVLRRIELRSGSTAFTVTQERELTLRPGEERNRRVRFDPQRLGLAEAHFVARFDSGDVEFTVRARAATACVVPPVELGALELGQSVERRFTLTNPLDQPGEAFVGELPPPFSVSPRGRVRLSPGESRDVVISLEPTTSGLVETRWRVRPSSDCLEAEVTVRALALDEALSFTPGKLDFGAPGAGTTITRSVTLRNRTSKRIEVEAFESTSPAFRVLTAAGALDADATLAVEIAATAPGPEPIAGELLARTSAGTFRLPLMLSFAAPCVTVTPERLDFATVEAGCPSEAQRVTLHNRCPHAVRLTPQVPEGFGLVSAPRRLAANETAEVALSATPRVEGLLQGALAVVVDVLDGAENVSLPLTVSASPPEVVTETTTVAASPWERADVLLLIDDSPAMLPIAASVARNLEQFGVWLSATQLDTRVAVMTTSTAPSALGRLRLTAGGAAWLTRPTAPALAAHAAITGTSQGRSSCLEALRAGLGGPVPLQGLPRRNTALAIICVTNGPDAIETAPMSTIGEILAALPPQASFSTVAHFGVPNCGGELERGALRPLVMITNGITEELCTPDWEVALERLGRTSFGSSTLFYLRRMPALARAPLKVWVDEIQLPEFDQPPFGRIWEWDGALNALRLDPTYALETGRTLKVQYHPQCGR